MKIVVYGPKKRTGVLKGGNIIDVGRALFRIGYSNAEYMADLQNLIEGGQPTLDILGSAAENLGEADEDIIKTLEYSVLHAPCVAKAKIACCGGNYPSHAVAMAKRRVERGEKSSIEGNPVRYVRNRGFWGFWKVEREPLGHNGKLSYPSQCEYLDYEGECAIIIGKTGKNIKSESIRDYVWGVTLLGDWSIRMAPEDGPLNFALQKNFDGCCSIGPSIAVGEIDHMKVELETRINGEVRQKFISGDMAFSYAEYLEYLSQNLTFFSGDIISGGTAEGTAMDSSPINVGLKPQKQRFLKSGDIVEIESAQIGLLRTYVT